MTPLLALSSTYQPPDYPGEMWLDAVGGLWNEVSLRGYSLGPLRVPASTPRHVVVMYKGGSTNMRRSIRGSLIDERVEPGDLSVKSVQNDGGWSWDRPLDVLHLYIDPGWLDSVAAEIHGPGLARIDLRDSVKTRDDELAWLLSSLEKEAADKPCGARLMIPLLQRQVGVALIRNYATLERHDTTRTRLSSEQTRIVHEYIAE
ncbi:MAG: hypothetical protein U1C74_01520, partial [Phenylobacterium sp.]|nr:hypothetical protein [Phenylobacterium sp.]